MTMRSILLGAAALAMLAPALSPMGAQMRRGDGDDAFAARRDGGVRPLRQIENGVVPGMKRDGADYIGAEYDGGSARYRLKFMRNGAVIWIDVDGRSGAVLARAGDR